jgi:anti-anti-sigma factor
MRVANFTVESRDGIGVIVASGEVDLAAADGFRRARDEAMRTRLPVAIDLTDCEFMDVAGIAWIVHAFQAGHCFALVGAGPQIRRLLDLIGIPDLVPCFDDLEQALASAPLHLARAKAAAG